MASLTEIARGKREYLAIHWPANPQLGRPEPIPCKLQVLTDEEFQEAIAAAHARLRELKLDVGPQTADDLEQEVSIQVLARALRDNEAPHNVAFVAGPADLRRNSTPWEREEVGVLWKEFQERRSPLRPLSAAEQQVLDDLVKKKDATTLRECGLNTLVSYLVTTVSPRST